MTQEPKLLTEADLPRFRLMTPQEREQFLRERGLIAPEPEPEPVDLLLIKAREICADASRCVQSSRAYNSGKWDDTISVRSALAALRRGMELAARPTLTRADVCAAYDDALADERDIRTALHEYITERLK